ncbi:MAG TPA: enoyl-CoA hydratase/isomerase family protein [Allosphingosinicella sp.]|nr:enoyl-CoA hydratase/isomerase family protein [Allosphingosinicella sp.]
MFRLSMDGEVARLTLDRPEARNAIPAAGWAELARLLVEAADARILILSGASGVFCAGADLSDFPALNKDDSARARFREDMRLALDGLRNLAGPTVALIEGPCYGAGVALAMACDIRIAAESASFAITPAKIGISYPQEDVLRLVELVGPGQAARLLFTASSIDGAEAARIGLVELHSIDEGELVAAILANDQDSLIVLKRAIVRAGEGLRSDPEQDARFDALIGGDQMARRLEALRRK